jgi:hypothetical protein
VLRELLSVPTHDVLLLGAETRFLEHSMRIDAVLTLDATVSTLGAPGPGGAAGSAPRTHSSRQSSTWQREICTLKAYIQSLLSNSTCAPTSRACACSHCSCPIRPSQLSRQGPAQNRADTPGMFSTNFRSDTTALYRRNWWEEEEGREG